MASFSPPRQTFMNTVINFRVPQKRENAQTVKLPASGEQLCCMDLGKHHVVPSDCTEGLKLLQHYLIAVYVNTTSVIRTIPLRILAKLVQLPYFSIDNARVIYTKRSKFVKNEHAPYTLGRYER